MLTHCIVDTHVFIGACLGAGASARVIAACLQGQARPLMGAALLAEYADVLGRDPLFAGCRLSAQERGDLLDIFLATCERTRVYFG